jgi:hypothetical protein
MNVFNPRTRKRERHPPAAPARQQPRGRGEPVRRRDRRTWPGSRKSPPATPCAPRPARSRLERIEFPEPVISMSIEPQVRRRKKTICCACSPSSPRRTPPSASASTPRPARPSSGHGRTAPGDQAGPSWLREHKVQALPASRWWPTARPSRPPPRPEHDFNREIAGRKQAAGVLHPPRAARARRRQRPGPRSTANLRLARRDARVRDPPGHRGRSGHRRARELSPYRREGVRVTRVSYDPVNSSGHRLPRRGPDGVPRRPSRARNPSCWNPSCASRSPARTSTWATCWAT